MSLKELVDFFKCFLDNLFEERVYNWKSVGHLSDYIYYNMEDALKKTNNEDFTMNMNVHHPIGTSTLKFWISFNINIEKTIILEKKIEGGLIEAKETIENILNKITSKEINPKAQINAVYGSTTLELNPGAKVVLSQDETEKIVNLLSVSLEGSLYTCLKNDFTIKFSIPVGMGLLTKETKTRYAIKNLIMNYLVEELNVNQEIRCRIFKK